MRPPFRDASSGYWARAAAALTVLAFVAALVPRVAVAGDLMLEHDTELGPEGLRVTGWTFTSLALLSFGFAAYSYTVTQDELDKADSEYGKYKDASTEEDAVKLHASVKDHHDKAKAAETRTNIALVLAVVFAATAFYSFSPESAPDFSITATTLGPRFEWRF